MTFARRLPFVAVLPGSILIEYTQQFLHALPPAMRELKVDTRPAASRTI
jgi:hypothetical protein